MSAIPPCAFEKSRSGSSNKAAEYRSAVNLCQGSRRFGDQRDLLADGLGVIGQLLDGLSILASPLTLDRFGGSVLELHGQKSKEPGDQLCVGGVIHVRTKPWVRSQVHIHL